MYNYYSVLYGRPADSRHGCCRLMVFSRNELGQEERRRSFRKRARLLISRPPNFTILAHYRDTPTTFPGRGRFAAFGRQENDRQDRNTRDDKHATPKYFHRPVVNLCVDDDDDDHVEPVILQWAYTSQNARRRVARLPFYPSTAPAPRPRGRRFETTRGRASSDATSSPSLVPDRPRLCFSSRRRRRRRFLPRRFIRKSLERSESAFFFTTRLLIFRVIHIRISIRAVCTNDVGRPS